LPKKILRISPPQLRVVPQANTLDPKGKTLQSFSSFEEADAAERANDKAMTPCQRLKLLERLRNAHYPDGRTPSRIQRVLEMVDAPRR